MDKIKMIGLDLDGTLLTEKKELPPYTRQILEQAVAKGIVVLPATGRPLTGIPQEIRRIRGIRYALTTNGARIYDLERMETIAEYTIPHKTAEKALEITRKYDTLQETYYDGAAYSDEGKLKDIGKYYRNPDMWEYVRATRTPVASVLQWFSVKGRSPDKIHLLFADPEEKKQAWAELQEIPGIVLTGSLGNNIEINAADVDKGRGLLKLGSMLGIRREEIMACGDGDNDLAMIREAGLGVAMGNADEALKKAADYVTETNEKEGAARAIEKFALKGGEIC